MGGKVIKTYEGVIYRENFETSPIRKVIEIMFSLRQKFKVEDNDFMQNLAKLLMSSLYGANIPTHITEEYKKKSENWMSTEYGESFRLLEITKQSIYS